jgi:hypothetical protein
MLKNTKIIIGKKLYSLNNESDITLLKKVLKKYKVLTAYNTDNEKYYLYCDKIFKDHYSYWALLDLNCDKWETDVCDTFEAFISALSYETFNQKIKYITNK